MRIKKDIEPQTTTYSAEIVFHIGESNCNDIPSDLRVGEIVGVKSHFDIFLATVKNLNPLTVTCTYRDEIKVSAKNFLGRVAFVENTKWLPNRIKIYDPTFNKTQEMKNEPLEEINLEEELPVQNWLSKTN